MRPFLAAIAFLTRVPVPGAASFDAVDVAKSAGWFPLVGVLLGSVYGLAAVVLRSHLPSAVVAALLVLLDVLLTGGLHFDGLADTADGFGGGKNVEDVLRMMRDHSIGSYGGVALATVVVLKVTAYSALLKQPDFISALILTPALGRWSILLLTANLPYARASASVVQGMRKAALFLGTSIVLAASLAAMSFRAWAAIGTVLLVSAGFGIYCRRRIAGITGDTLGANLELCESVSLLAYLWT